MLSEPSVRMKVAAASSGLAYAARKKTRLWPSQRVASFNWLKRPNPCIPAVAEAADLTTLYMQFAGAEGDNSHRPARGLRLSAVLLAALPSLRSSPARGPAVLRCGRPSRAPRREQAAASTIPRCRAGTSAGVNCASQHPQRRVWPRWAQGWGDVGRSRWRPREGHGRSVAR
jgi:hypothetical protein